MDVIEIKRALANRAEEFCRWLYPAGRKESQEWCVGDVSGAAGKSLRIHLGGNKAGVWADFSGDAKGDNLLELLIQRDGSTFRAALEKAREWLGVPSDSVRPAAPRQYQKPSKKGITRRGSKVENYLTMERGLSKRTLEAYKIAQLPAKGENGPAIVFPYINRSGELEMLKFRAVEPDASGKKKVWSSPGAKKGLMGKHLITDDHRAALICEGEIDAMSWYELGVVGMSVPFGAKWEGASGEDPNMEWIENDWELLQGFETIILCFDADDAGKRAAESIARRLGLERCMLVQMPPGVKDVNEALLAGRKDELLAALDNAKPLMPENLRSAADLYDDLHDMLLNPDQAKLNTGLPMMFETKTGAFHWRLHELTVFSGTNGSGKTMLLNWLMTSGWIVQNKRRVLDISLEVPAKQTLAYQIGQLLGKERPENEKELRGALDLVAHNLWFYDYVGKVDRKAMFEAIRYAIRRYGVSFIVIDSFMKCGFATDDYNGQVAFLNELTDFVRDHPVHVVLVVHTKKLENDRARAGKTDVKGAGEVTDLAHNVFLVTRNKEKEAKMRQFAEDGSSSARIKADTYSAEHPDTIFACVKQRNGLGEEPEYGLWFDKHSRQFHSSPQEPLCLVVDPSTHHVQEIAEDDAPDGEDVGPF